MKAIGLISLLVALPSPVWAARFTGRVAINDAFDCTGGTTSAAMPWRDCHAFKRHFSPNGAAITSSAFVENALRPVSATVFFVFSVLGQQPCATALVRADRDGRYSLPVPSCIVGREAFVNPTVMLYFDVPLAGGGTAGQLRSLWARQDVVPLYGSSNLTVNTLVDTVFSTDDGSGRIVDYIHPTFTLDRVFLNSTQTRQFTIPFGTQIVLGMASTNPTDFARGALALWQNVAEIHFRARDLLGSRSDLYRKLFVTQSQTACTNCYTAYFSFPGQFGGGMGGWGSFTTASPEGNLTTTQIAALSAAGLPAHEIGHSIHAGAAPNGMTVDYTFADSRTNRDGSDYGLGGHIALAAAGAPQLQGMDVAFVEGFGNMTARLLLLDGCNGPDRTIDFPGDLDMTKNMWNPDAYTACDGAAGSGCPLHSFRFHMKYRGIAENSSEWNRRYNALRNLAATASAAGMRRVVSNNEQKMRTFLCSLVAAQPDYQSAAGLAQGQRYLRDYTYLVSEILDGRTPAVTQSTYASDITTSIGHISFAQLLDAMTDICSDCNQFPSPLPAALWTHLPLTDGANAAYDSQRISINGRFSPQTLGRALMNRGLFTKAQLNNALRASFMEEVP